MNIKISNKSLLENEKITKLIIFALLFVVYMLPSGLLTNYFKINIAIDKLLFSSIMIILYIVNKIKTRKISIPQVIFIITVLFFTILNKNINYLLFLTILFLEDIIEYKDNIIQVLKKSDVLWLCLGFTIFYSIFYKLIGIVRVDRFAFSAIGEINQSGLAIFCLSLLLMVKNKKIGIAVMLAGLLTISRSYFIAVAIYAISKLHITEKIIDKIKNIKYCNYFVLTIISCVLLIFIGLFFIYENSIGNVYWGDDVENRLVNLLDYSNLFRFLTNIVLIMIFINKPFKLLTGLSNVEYTNMGKECYNLLNINYKYLNPHNLFFSHLRIYGIFVILETFYISRILQKIVNKYNLLIYIAIVLYSILLGAGLYSYWLYLSCFTLMIVNKCNEKGGTV